MGAALLAGMVSTGTTVLAATASPSSPAAVAVASWDRGGDHHGGWDRGRDHGRGGDHRDDRGHGDEHRGDWNRCERDHHNDWNWYYC
ncbi:MAG TPA: hypothetical protein VGE42_06140 [Candidatus Dormibacteraeota bacterium]